MSVLTLTLQQTPPARVDMSPVIPERLEGLKAKAVAAIKLDCGGRPLPLGELFAIEDGDASELRIRRSHPRLARIGAAMSRGAIRVGGAAGAFLGQNMRGGLIEVKGNAGEYLGSGMRGGRIDVHGDAGDRLGAPIPGEQLGLRNGVIRVRGNAGARAGDRMRRGLVVIEGDAGDYLGARMIAGTIVVLGQAGDFTGYGMGRGTLLLQRTPKSMPATFNDCGEFRLAFLQLLYRQLAETGIRPEKNRVFADTVRRYAGDLAWSGKGEVLIMRANASLG